MFVFVYVFFFFVCVSDTWGIAFLADLVIVTTSLPARSYFCERVQYGR